MMNSLMKLGNLGAPTESSATEMDGAASPQAEDSSAFSVELALIQSALNGGGFESKRPMDTGTTLARSLPVVTLEQPLDEAENAAQALSEEPMLDERLMGEAAATWIGASPPASVPLRAAAVPTFERPSAQLEFEVEIEGGERGAILALDPSMRRASLSTDGHPLDLVLPAPLLGGPVLADPLRSLSAAPFGSSAQASAPPFGNPMPPDHALASGRGSAPQSASTVAPLLGTGSGPGSNLSSTGDDGAATQLRPTVGLVSHASNALHAPVSVATASGEMSSIHSASISTSNGMPLVERVALGTASPAIPESALSGQTGIAQAASSVDSRRGTPTEHTPLRDEKASLHATKAPDNATTRTEVQAATERAATRSGELAAMAAKPGKSSAAPTGPDGSPIVVRDAATTSAVGSFAAASRSSAEHGNSMGTAERQEIADLAVSRMTLRHGARAAIDLPDFGRITVDARLRAGQVDLSVVTERAAAATALQALGPQLESELRSAQVPLKDLTIDQGSPHNRGTNDTNAHTDPQTTAGGRGNGGGRDKDTAVTDPLVDPPMRQNAFGRRVRIVL